MNLEPNTIEYVNKLFTALLNGETLIRRYPDSDYTLYKLINGELHSELNFAIIQAPLKVTSPEDLFDAAHNKFPLEIYKGE